MDPIIGQTVLVTWFLIHHSWNLIIKSGAYRVITSITPQRLAALRILAASEDHPVAEQIFEKVWTEFSTTSLATIYNTAVSFKRLNEVLEPGFLDGSDRYDDNMLMPHPHVICNRRREIMDPELMGLDELEEEVIKKTGFIIQNRRLDFLGVCKECQDAK